jgi:hypothetical protein
MGHGAGPMWKEEMIRGNKSRLTDYGKLDLKSKGNIQTLTNKSSCQLFGLSSSVLAIQIA